MYLIFVDDSKRNATRFGVDGKLVAVGSLCLDADRSRAAEKAVDQLCKDVGFPAAEEFKWSPRKTDWMYSGLVDEDRKAFYKNLATILTDSEAFAAIVIEDDGRNTATGVADAESDVLTMLFERLAHQLRSRATTGLIITDRPSGDRKEENKFLAECLARLEVGTPYVQHNELAFVTSTDSRLVRLLQAADVITSCMTAYVGGSRYAEDVAPYFLPLFPTERLRGGRSVKLHPDYVFVNLYHWLFGDADYWRFGMGWSLPKSGHPYYESATKY